MFQRILAQGKKVLPASVVIGLLAICWFSIHKLQSGGDHDALSEAARSAKNKPADTSLVILPEGKLRAGRPDIETVARRPIQSVLTVPGRLRYDASKHVDIKSPVDGILVDSLVKPGDRVNAGDALGAVSSPEIGQARADVLKYEAELALVQRRAERDNNIADNLQRMLAQLANGISVDEIEVEFRDKPLGTYRNQLLTAWTAQGLARQLAETARPLAKSGTLAAKTLNQRESQRQAAEAAFQSIRDQATFDSRQEQQQSQNEVADARRRLQIARHQLETLLGYPEQHVSADDSASLTKLIVRAPFAGTIESRSFANMERVSRDDSLFVLADTSSLFVAADIRENDWAAVSLRPGQTITVVAPAIPGERLTARVHYVGREVDVSNNSVPLIAIIDNRDNRLWPGMFVRVSLPIGQPHEAVVVRPQAVVQHENEQFVFVATGERRFRRVDVKTGQATDDWVEVLGGLQPGQHVVDHGAFMLKSELLLEGEEE